MLSKVYNKNIKFIIIMFGVLFSFLVFQTNIEAKSTLDTSGIESAFPDSYKPYLRELARKHPNWKFVAVNLNLRWDTCLQEETVDRKNLIPKSYSSEWKKNNIEIEPGWVNASNSAIAYAMDPRNFLTESSIFQFELTTNDPNIHTSDVIDKVLDGVPMGDQSLKRKYKNAGNWLDMNKSYSEIIANSAVTNNVSGVHLASRIRQETAGDIINNLSINGSYPGYEGLYNFFNIGATTDGGRPPIENALIKARQEGWDNPEKSINAAGKKIYNDYTKWGQNTVYFEKWDVNDPYGGQSLFWMQYMSNILAPSSESNRMYIAYNKAGKLNSSFTFHIPVYLGMPSQPAKVGDEARFEDDNTKVYLDDTSDIGVNDVFKIRSEPNTNAPVVATITETQEGAKNRTKMTRIKKGVNTQWDKVRLDNDLEGYVFSEYVHVYTDYIKVTNVKLNKNKTEIKSGSKETFTSTVLPENAEFKKVRYTSNNESVMTVDKNGVVTARDLGAATLFAISDDNKNIYDTCYVSVAYSDILNVPMGKTVSIMKAQYKNAIFSTNNSNVLSLTQDGKIIGNNLGDATVFVKDVNGNVLSCFFVRVSYTEYKNLKIGESATIETKGTKYYTNNSNVLSVSSSGVITTTGLGDASVFVENANGKVIAMIYVKSAYTDAKKLKVGESVSLGIKGTKYYTNNTNVVTVSNTGIMTARGLGDATVFVEDVTGSIAAMIYVKGAYTDVKRIKVGDTINSEIKAAKYYTNNTTVLEVSNTGSITGRFLGDATVFAQDKDGRIVAMIYVSATYTDSKTIYFEESVNIKETFGLTSAKYNNAKFSINNEKVAKINGQNIIGMSIGECTLYVKDSSNKNIAIFFVSVKEYVEVEKVVINNTNVDLKVGQNYNLGAYVVPDNAKYKELNYSSDNKDVALVSNTGDVDAKFLGSSTITIKSTDKKTNKDAKCKVNVGYTANLQTDILTPKNLKEVINLEKIGAARITTNNEKVIKVDKNGNVTPTGVGDASIFVFDSKDKLVALVYVKVIDYVKVTQIRLKEKEINLKVGKDHKISYEIVPNNAKYKDVEFKSNDDSIAKVDKNGVITAKFLGSAVITIMTKDKNNIVYSQLKVNNSYTDSLSLTQNQSVNLYEHLKLSGSVTSYTYETNNNKVLGLDGNTSLLRGISKGDASVFVKDRNNNLVAILYVLVK